jgi:hypothetical protein
MHGLKLLHLFHHLPNVVRMWLGYACTSRRNTKVSSSEEKKAIPSFWVVVGTHVIQNFGKLCLGNIARWARNPFEYHVVGTSGRNLDDLVAKSTVDNLESVWLRQWRQLRTRTP